jgi:hypothetical protein
MLTVATMLDIERSGTDERNCVKTHRSQIRTAAGIVLSCGIYLVSGCVYRFSNLHVSTPQGIRSVAVEGIHDISREILPHELLWEELQRAIAAEGHLRVVSATRADALLRARIKSARFSPAGTVVRPQPLLQDPPAMQTGDIPYNYKDFRALTEAAELMPSTGIAIEVELQLWHLQTRELLFERTYVQSESFLSVRPSTSPRNNHLRENEAFRSDFARMSRSIADRFMSDLLM